MASIKRKKNDNEWYNNPDIITNLIILLIVIIVILSQSFAINNNLSPMNILSNILNHNIIYLLVFIYFVALKTKTGKKYFDFLNLFLIILYGITSITSLLTVFQSFGLSSLLGMAIDVFTLIFLVHTLLRSSRLWESVGLNKSPFNEITIEGYFYTILILDIILMAINFIFTTSFAGTVLAFLDTCYTILFTRYVFLYGEFLNSRKIAINNVGNFNECKEVIKNEIEDFVLKHDLDEKYESVKDKLSEISDDVKTVVSNVKDDVANIIDDVDLDEKVEVAKEKVNDFVDDAKEKFIDVKEDVSKKIKDAKIDEKINDARDAAVAFTEVVKEEVGNYSDVIKKEISEIKIDVKSKVTEMSSSKKNDGVKKEISSRKKKISKKNNSKKVTK